jgi:ureidoacrylate peracid hydrolase
MNAFHLFDEKVNPVHTAVLIVDVQNDFVHEKGSLAQVGRDVRPAQTVVPLIETLVDKTRENGARLIWVRTEHAPWTNSAAWLGRIRKKQDIRHFPICLIGTWGSEMYRLKVQAGEAVVTKHRYSAFLNTDLDLILRSLEIRTVVIAGVTTNVCVESTARDAAMRDYYTIILSDCTAADSDAEHRVSLYTLDHYFGIVTTSTELFAAWQVQSG